MILSFGFISGVMFGFELVDKEDLEEGPGVFLVVDLFIVRIFLEKAL